MRITIIPAIFPNQGQLVSLSLNKINKLVAAIHDFLKQWGYPLAKLHYWTVPFELFYMFFGELLAKKYLILFFVILESCLERLFEGRLFCKHVLYLIKNFTNLLLVSSTCILEYWKEPICNLNQLDIVFRVYLLFFLTPILPYNPNRALRHHASVIEFPC